MMGLISLGSRARAILGKWGRRGEIQLTCTLLGLLGVGCTWLTSSFVLLQLDEHPPGALHVPHVHAKDSSNCAFLLLPTCYAQDQSEVAASASYDTCGADLALCRRNASACARGNVRKTLIVVYLRKKLQQVQDRVRRLQQEQEQQKVFFLIKNICIEQYQYYEMISNFSGGSGGRSFVLRPGS